MVNHKLEVCRVFAIKEQNLRIPLNSGLKKWTKGDYEQWNKEVKDNYQWFHLDLWKTKLAKTNQKTQK